MIRLPSPRILIAIAILVLFLFFLIAFLFVTQLSFSVWEQLQQKPDWLIWSYFLLFILLAMLFGRIIWRLLLPKRSNNSKTSAVSSSEDNMNTVVRRLENMSQNMTGARGVQVNSQRQKPLPEKEINNTAQQERTESDDNEINVPLLEQWAREFNASPEVASIRAELEEYSRRKSSQEVYIALFGDISSGKSSLIRALIPPEAQQELKIQSSVIGGTTREIKHYHWHQEQSNTGQTIILTDMPGLNEQFAELDPLATEEVRRAHIALYLCDGDLTATQFEELKCILLLHKPCIVVVNKSDRFNDEERKLIITNIENRLSEFDSKVSVISINAGGMREYIRLTPDGQEERVQHAIEPDVANLLEELQKIFQHYEPDLLEQLREKSVANMINTKLDELDAHFKQSQSRRMVQSYTKKAVVASMATISPGTDLLVQGYLGIQMVKELCQLYEVSATDIDANKLIELIQSRMDKTMPLLLAIAGNGLKAFPGVGTVTGGLMHAVAYGMIFDTLGRSIARTLEVTGELSPTLVSDLYKEQLGENIESRTKDFIKLVLKLRKKD